MVKLTTENFIQRAKAIHGDKYDYSKVNYINSETKVCIICPIHGEVFVTPYYHLNSIGCNKCGNQNGHKKRSLGIDFLKKSMAIHNNKYDYSKVEYVNNYTKVCIICPIHGEFWQRPFQHLRGHGCPICYYESNKRKIYNECINNSKERNNITYKRAYHIWLGMLKRGYDLDFKKRNPSYTNCTVCKEWKNFDSFHKWYNEHYIEGYHLDKDILVKGNREYSPDKCCFVPASINSLFVKPYNRDKSLPIGIKLRNGKFLARITKDKKTYQIGSYDNPLTAFNAYKIEKERYIKEVADKWKDKLEPKVYQALYNYQVEITD